MKRSEFLKSFGLGAGGLILPNAFIQTQTVKIYDNYVRGLHFYKYREIESAIKAGDELLLKREPRNKYDCFAIQVNYEDVRLGYIAAYENIVLANMMDGGVPLKAYVSQKNPKTNNLFNALAIEVFAEIVSPTAKLIEHLLAEKRADDAEDKYRGKLKI